MNIKRVRTSGQIIILLAFIVGTIVSFTQERAAATVPFVNTIVNTTSTGAQVTDNNTPSNSNITASSDGRFVLFASSSAQLVPSDTNARTDWFVKDTKLNTVVRANVKNNGGQLSGYVQLGASISSNGQHVAFVYGNSSNELPGGNANHVYVRDLKNNSTKLISQSSAGLPANGSSFPNSWSIPSISADGRYVAFTSDATNLVSNDTNAQSDVFLRDTKLNTTTILSNTDAGLPSDAYSGSPVISCDGAYIAFKSNATNLITGTLTTNYGVYLVDRASGNTIKNIAPNANASASNSLSMSCDGSTLIFTSNASNLVANDTNNTGDLFAYKIYEETIERINVATDGTQNTSSVGPLFGISFNGQYVAFTSNASSLVANDSNNQRDIFIRDLTTAITDRVNMRYDGTQTTSFSDNPSITQDGRSVLYFSNDSGLVASDTNGRADVFMSKTGY